MPPIRSVKEIQRAHDLLVGILLGDLGEPPPGEIGESMQLAAAVLCWVLRHDHNLSFERFLAKTEDETKKAGFDLRQVN